jgi:hypothetical protein
MSAGIEKLHWGSVVPTGIVRKLARFGQVVAIWPGPVDSDYCFSQAGLKDFADSDEAWDADWRRVVVRTVQQLEEAGVARIQVRAEVREIPDGSTWKQLKRWLEGPPNTFGKQVLGIEEQVIVVSNDDQFGEILVEFGEPAICGLWAGMGHPVLWVGFATGDIDVEEWLAGIADGLPVVRSELK